MITLEIISYIKAELAKGIPDLTIKSNLLANGWSENDVTEAMASISSQGIPQPPSINTDLKEYKKKVMWTTFFVLIGLDILIILGAKSFYGTWGVFGISLSSILLRILVIYLISAFAVRGSSKEEKTSKTVAKAVFRVIGTILLTIIISVGIFFVGCLFLLSGIK